LIVPWSKESSKVKQTDRYHKPNSILGWGFRDMSWERWGVSVERCSFVGIDADLYCALSFLFCFSDIRSRRSFRPFLPTSPPPLTVDKPGQSRPTSLNPRIEDRDLSTYIRTWSHSRNQSMYPTCISCSSSLGSDRPCFTLALLRSPPPDYPLLLLHTRLFRSPSTSP
jgi:hypothetical protein